MGKKKPKRVWFFRTWSQWWGSRAMHYRYQPLSPVVHVDLRLFGLELFSFTAHWNGLPSCTTYAAIGILGNHMSVGREDEFRVGEIRKPTKRRKSRAKVS